MHFSYNSIAKCKNLNLGKSEVRYFEGERNNLKSIKRHWFCSANVLPSYTVKSTPRKLLQKNLFACNAITKFLSFTSSLQRGLIRAKLAIIIIGFDAFGMLCYWITTNGSSFQNIKKNLYTSTIVDDDAVIQPKLFFYILNGTDFHFLFLNMDECIYHIVLHACIWCMVGLSCQRWHNVGMHAFLHICYYFLLNFKTNINSIYFLHSMLSEKLKRYNSCYSLLACPSLLLFDQALHTVS